MMLVILGEFISHARELWVLCSGRIISQAQPPRTTVPLVVVLWHKEAFLSILLK